MLCWLLWWQVCSDDMCWHRGQCGVVTLAPSSDMHRWCPHHHVIHVNDPCAFQREQNTSSELTEFRSVPNEDIFSWHVFLDPCFHVTFSALSAGSTSHSMFTVQVYSLPVHWVYNTCTPQSRAIHSVVRRPQRGQHQWTALQESKWDLAFQW